MFLYQEKKMAGVASGEIGTAVVDEGEDGIAPGMFGHSSLRPSSLKYNWRSRRRLAGGAGGKGAFGLHR